MRAMTRESDLARKIGTHLPIDKSDLDEVDWTAMVEVGPFTRASKRDVTLFSAVILMGRFDLLDGISHEVLDHLVNFKDEYGLTAPMNALIVASDYYSPMDHWKEHFMFFLNHGLDIHTVADWTDPDQMEFLQSLADEVSGIAHAPVPAPEATTSAAASSTTPSIASVEEASLVGIGAAHAIDHCASDMHTI